MWVAELRRVLFLVLEYLHVGRRPRICVFLFNLGSVDVSIAFYPTVRCFLSLQSPTSVHELRSSTMCGFPELCELLRSPTIHAL